MGSDMADVGAVEMLVDLTGMKQMPNLQDPDALVHYGRLKAARDVSVDVFGLYGQSAHFAFGRKEFAFLRSHALPNWR